MSFEPPIHSVCSRGLLEEEGAFLFHQSTEDCLKLLLVSLRTQKVWLRNLHLFKDYKL